MTEYQSILGRSAEQFSTIQVDLVVDQGFRMSHSECFSQQI